MKEILHRLQLTSTLHSSVGYERGEIVAVEIGWWPSFALLPHRTITGRWIWFCKCYKRIVWRYTGFTDEPFTEYATMFEVLAEKN